MLTKFKYPDGETFEIETYYSCKNAVNKFEDILDTPRKDDRLYIISDKGGIYKTIKDRTDFKLDDFLNDITEFNLKYYLKETKTGILKKVIIFNEIETFDYADITLLHLYYFMKIMFYKFSDFDQKDLLFQDEP